MLSMFFENSEDDDYVVDVCSHENAKSSKQTIYLSLNIDNWIAISHYNNAKTLLISMWDHYKFVTILWMYASLIKETNAINDRNILSILYESD